MLRKNGSNILTQVSHKNSQIMTSHRANKRLELYFVTCSDNLVRGGTSLATFCFDDKNKLGRYLTGGKKISSVGKAVKTTTTTH